MRRLVAWIKIAIFGPKRKPHPNGPRRQLGVDQLEDRVVPATIQFSAAALTPTVYEGNLVA